MATQDFLIATCNRKRFLSTRRHHHLYGQFTRNATFQSYDTNLGRTIQLLVIRHIQKLFYFRKLFTTKILLAHDSNICIYIYIYIWPWIWILISCLARQLELGPFWTAMDGKVSNRVKKVSCDRKECFKVKWKSVTEKFLCIWEQILWRISFIKYKKYSKYLHIFLKSLPKVGHNELTRQ
jgi:hypothetical protein